MVIFYLPASYFDFRSTNQQIG